MTEQERANVDAGMYRIGYRYRVLLGDLPGKITPDPLYFKSAGEVGPFLRSLYPDRTIAESVVLPKPPDPPTPEAWAAAHGGQLAGGINWTWAYFGSEGEAKLFVEWLDQNGYEHRGVYPPRNDESWGVRFR